MNLPASLCEGRYTLIEVLGSGGMATVYRAYDHRLKVWRALKLLSAEFGRKKKLRARFDSEAHAMAMLEHANIVRVYDVGVDGDQPYIVMELCEGGSPIDWLEQHGAMPARLATQVVLQLCAGIGAAHAAGIIHRDIKPHNVLTTAKGACKVTDFGIARLDDSELKSAMTKTGSVMGTLGFMAPEQRLDAKGVDIRADVYAIGATLYTLLTNRTNMDLFAAEQDDGVLAEIHPALRPILIRATQYKRDLRYPDVASVIVALEEAFPELPRDPADTPALAMPMRAAPPIPSSPTLAPAAPAEPTVSVEPAPTGRGRLVARSATPAPSGERSLANMPFPKAEPRRAPSRGDVPVGSEEAPVPSRAAQMQANSEHVPEYQVVSEPPNPLAGAYTIDLQTGEATQRSGEGGADGEDEEEDDQGNINEGGAKDLLEFVWQIAVIIFKGLLNPLKMIAGPFAVFGGLGVLVMAFGATRVDGAHTYALQTEVAYAAVLDENIANVTGLVIEAGGSEVVIQPALDAYQRALTAEDRLEAADKLLDIVREQASIPQVSTRINQSGHRGQIDQALMKLTAAQRERAAAHEAWKAASSSMQGRWAVGCHAAEAPEAEAPRR